MKTKQTEKGSWIGYYIAPGKPLRSIHSAPQPSRLLALQAIRAMLVHQGEIKS